MANCDCGAVSFCDCGSAFEHRLRVRYVGFVVEKHVARGCRNAAGLRFDVVMIDGNHEPDYLRREVATIAQLLDPGGVLALDDVDTWWRELAAVFTEISESDEWPFEQVGYDGRVGLLRRQ